MEEVYLVQHPRLPRLDALKILPASHGGTTKTTVKVAITPLHVNAAPTATVTVSQPDTNGVVVHGSVTATDPDGDTLTYSGPATTTKGSIHIDNTGAFTYTPTGTARHNAAATNAAATGANQDTFTISFSARRISCAAPSLPAASLGDYRRPHAAPARRRAPGAGRSQPGR
jgi:VCBS repeat-containing protein